MTPVNGSKIIYDFMRVSFNVIRSSFSIGDKYSMILDSSTWRMALFACNKILSVGIMEGLPFSGGGTL